MVFFIRVVREGRGGPGVEGRGGVSMGIWEGMSLQEKKNHPLPSSGTKPSAEIFNVRHGGRRTRRRRLAWTGTRGLLAWIWSQGKKFAMLTCDEQEVSAQLGCLSCLVSTTGRRDKPGSSTRKEKKRKGNHKAQHHHSHRERQLPLSNAMRRGGFLYSHYF